MNGATVDFILECKRNDKKWIPFRRYHSREAAQRVAEQMTEATQIPCRVVERHWHMWHIAQGDPLGAAD